MRCTSATPISATSVAKYVVSRMGRNTSAGLAAPSCARYTMMLIGMSVSPDVFSTRNMICAFVAVSFSGFNVCSSFMALSPSGVAALSSPSMLAEKFMMIEPSAG